ncbi:MAG: alpha-2-macroglobulin family protein, partial [Hyphomicrobiales bacterium]
DDLFANLAPGTGSVTLTVSNGLLIDTAGLLNALDRYPYGCSEQIVSRALPLLYLNQVAGRVGIGADGDIRGRVETAILKVLQRQGANGSIGLWRPGGEDLWLDAYVADFLTRAREVGYKVPGGAFTQLLDRLENSLTFAGDVPAAGREIAYALYVLARNSRASIGDLRYFVDTRLGEFSSPLAKAQLGGALAIYGDSLRADKAFSAAFNGAKQQVVSTTGRYDFGSRLRDGAAVLALATEGAGSSAPRADLIKLVEEHRAGARARATSTQENAWMLLAVNAANRADDQLSLTFNGVDLSGKFSRRFTALDLSAPATIVNRSQTPTRAVVTVRGVPASPEPAMANGFSLSRQYFSMDGTPVNPAEVGQNERLVVVLEAVVQDPRATNPIIVDLLPAGFEIDNPRLVRGGETGEISWLGEMTDPDHTEFRDDRFVAAYTDTKTGDKLKAAYVVRAVSPGRFVQPPAVVEDMYVTELRARTDLGRVTVVGPRAR